MADKKPWIGKETLPTVWVWICVLFNIVGILALLMLIIAELVIIVNDFSNYKDQYGQSYPARGYVGEVGCGYVAWTNAPKHTGSAVWMILYQISIIIFATIVIASDLAWRSASYNQWGGHYVEMFYAGGVMAGEHNKGLFYYVIANGFLKMFIVVLYMSQSFYGLSGGSHDPGDLSRVTGFATVATPATAITNLRPTTTTVVVGAAAQTGTIITGQNGGTLQVRAVDALTELVKRVGPDPNDPAAAYGTELWAQWAGWILLGSIIPSIIAFMFLVPWAAKKNEESKPADAEKGKS